MQLRHCHHLSCDSLDKINLEYMRQQMWRSCSNFEYLVTTESEGGRMCEVLLLPLGVSHFGRRGLTRKSAQNAWACHVLQTPERVQGRLALLAVRGLICLQSLSQSVIWHIMCFTL